jgi:hypothetical protein
MKFGSNVYKRMTAATHSKISMNGFQRLNLSREQTVRCGFLGGLCKLYCVEWVDMLKELQRAEERFYGEFEVWGFKEGK